MYSPSAWEAERSPTSALMMTSMASRGGRTGKDKVSTAYGMQISVSKTELMTNSTSGIDTEIKVNGQELETVTSFKYISSVITDEGSKPEILSRTAQPTARLTKLKPVWNDRSISLSSKIRLMHSPVLSIFLYACESWTLTAELQRRIQAMEMRCYRKILRISYIIIIIIIIIIINPLTARVVGEPHDFATRFLHFSLFSTALWDFPNSRPVHSLMLSSHLFLCPPCLLPPFTVPCKMVLARPN